MQVVARQRCILQPYPNPVHSVLNTTVNLNSPVNIICRIINGSNATVMTFTQSGTTGSNPIALNVSNLFPGAYRLVINYGREECAGTFIKF